LHPGIEISGEGPQHALELPNRLIRQAGLAERQRQALAHVVKARAAAQRLPIGLDGVSQLAGLAIGVSERGLEVGQLGLGQPIDETRSRAVGVGAGRGPQRAAGNA
jgi:hypothetical protein